jgi:hypothetical protein
VYRYKKNGRNRGVFVRAQRSSAHLILESSLEENMKVQKLVPIGILLVLSAATLSAQNTLPDPHNDACWQSLSALRACELEQYNLALDQAQRCTSYPEYQCMPASVEESNSKAKIAKRIPKTNNADTSAREKPALVPASNAQSAPAQPGGSN